MTEWHKGANSFVRETLSKILTILRAKIKAVIVQERIWASFSLEKKKVKRCYKIGRGDRRGDGGIYWMGHAKHYAFIQI